jgi:hypothetical protein
VSWELSRRREVINLTGTESDLFTETNDNSVAIFLSYGAARVLLADDAEAREQDYVASGIYTRH